MSSRTGSEEISMSTSLPRDAWVQFGDEQGVLFASAMSSHEESVSRFVQRVVRFPPIRGVCREKIVRQPDLDVRKNEKR